ncbi:MAG: hypothetical protein AB7F19_04990 [Candidatus Babeliales bacterium]
MLLSSMFFTLINFGIFIVLCVYLYQKYGKQLLFEHMRSQEDAVQILKLEAEAFHEEEQRLKKQIVEESQLIETLQEKVARWRAATDAALDNERKAQAAIQIQLKKKAQQQGDWYAKYTLAQRILPEVIQKTHDQLVHVFDPLYKKQEYTEHIVHFLEKSKQ